MKSIFVGLVIIFGVFLVADFIYTTDNYCEVNTGIEVKNANCGLIKEQFDIDINLFGRYW